MPDGAKRATLVVAAMPEELLGLRRALAFRHTVHIGGVRRHVGRLGRHPVVLGAVGVGPVRARVGTVALLAQVPAIRLIIVGMAGGLSRGLRAGDLIVPETLFELDGSIQGGITSKVPAQISVRASEDRHDAMSPEQPGFRPDAALFEWALASPGAQRAMLLSARRPLLTKAAKVHALGMFPESERDAMLAAVDQESATLAKIARARGLPFVVLRSISDTADESLPSYFAPAVREDGSFSKRGIVMRSLAFPPRLSELARLSLRLREGARVLANGVVSLMERLPEEGAVK